MHEAWSRRVVVMVREPVAGAVKTRLAYGTDGKPGIGAARATGFYRHTSRNVVERLRRDPRWQTWLAVTPDARAATPAWNARIPRRPQGHGDLGARMQRVFDTMPPGPVIIIGTDIPQIDPTRIGQAFAALARNDAIFGPADDGGYWLVGLARRTCVPRIFANVRWSTPHTRDDTLANMRNLAVALVDSLDDVDDADGHTRLGAYGTRLILPLSGR